MKLGKYINQLLPEKETVIVPGFGAFTTIEKPAQIDEDGENILPPAKAVAFNPQIRNNDGLLVGYIANQENVSHFDALHIIEKEREDILYRLDKGEKVELEEVGTFWYNESHDIQFKPVLRADFSPESFGLTATSLTGPDLAAGDEPGEKETGQKQDSIAEEPVVQPEPEQDFEPVEEIDPEFENETQEKRKKRSWIWLLLILIPLAGAGIYFAMNQDKTPTEASAPEKVEQINEPEITSPEETAAIDSMLNDSLERAANDTVPALEITRQISGEPKFYLIAGSFKEEENVSKYMRELENDNYEPFYLGKKGNFHLVGISTYNSLREALIKQDSFLAEHPESGAWIYEEIP